MPSVQPFQARCYTRGDIDRRVETRVAPDRCPDLLRFGTFEVDFRAGELRKQGAKIRLQDLPFQFLVVLLERPGEVVTREELIRRLWSEHAAIDVENGLNTAAKKVRTALRDDAEQPRFIETLPRRGYRFIGAVEAVDPAAAPGPAQGIGAADRPRPDASGELPVSISPPPRADPRPAVSRRGWLALPAVILLAAAAIWLLAPSGAPRTLRTIQLTTTGRVEPYTDILTDGSRIYFDERTGGKWSLAQVSVEGGTPSPIPAPPGIPSLRAISPDRSRLLVTIAQQNEDDAPLWIVPAVAGYPRRVGNVLAHTAVWSPDGSAIVYALGQALYRTNDDGSDPRKLADTPGPADFLRWLPGKPGLLRFTIIGARYAMWECAPDGRGMRPFVPSRPSTEAARGVFGAGWTREGRYFLFESRNDRGTGLWAVREERDFWHPFRARPFQFYVSPAELGVLVPGVDGRKVYFAAGHDSRDLVRYDAKRGQFLPFLPGIAGRAIAFSPDGQWLAYSSVPQGDLWRARTDGSDRLQLTSRPLEAIDPQWSPDGRQIAFGGIRANDDRFQIYMVPASGGAVEHIRTDGCRHADTPMWSADGKSLLFECIRPGPEPAFRSILLLNLKTRQISELAGSAGLWHPVWSPDGRYVAALADSGRQVKIYEMATHRALALLGAGNYGAACWARNSRYFYVQQVMGDEEQPIFRVNAATHAVERAMTAQQIPQSGFSGYTLTGITPDDAPIATVLRRNGDLYAIDVDLP